MIDRVPRNPFEQLDEFEDLKSLVYHILDSLKVHEVKVPMPLDFDKSQINDPGAILPVNDLWIGNASFEYILHRAEYVIAKVKEKIHKVDIDITLSFTDKIKLLSQVRKEIYGEYRYFDSMNPIRYMSSYKWKIVTTTSENGKTIQEEQFYPNSKLALSNSHWHILDNTFSIRRHLLYEIIFLIDNEIERVNEQLNDTKYGWEGKKWEYELYELSLALLATKKVVLIKGTESTFLHDFLAFFGKPDTRMSYWRGKIRDRKKRAEFIFELEKSLEKLPRKPKPSESL